MNYLGHALAFLDDDDPLTPWRVAGTALPDWLRFIDRRARIRGPQPLDDDPRVGAIFDGVTAHHEDDHLFHTAAAFDDEAHRLAAEVRDLEPGLRASTLAHVSVELLLDATLMADDPARLERFYDILDHVDEDVIIAVAEAHTGRALVGGSEAIRRFRATRFMEAYVDDEGLLRCLQGVCRRVGMAVPSSRILPALAASRARVPALRETLHPVHQARFARRAL